MHKGITVTAHNKAEWARAAKDCYAKGASFYGHRFSAKAALPEGAMLPLDVFDTLQRLYRIWLIDGVKAL